MTGSVQHKDKPVLVLSRKANESINIDHTINVVVLEIRGKSVRLGIDAPVEIPVNRQEVYEAIQRAIQQEAEEEQTAESVEA